MEMAAVAAISGMETLTMTGEERKRMTLLAGVKEERLSLAEAAEAMGLCYRQAKRVWARYKKQGDAGLAHRSRGRKSGRGKPEEMRKAVLARYRERYPDFGPTLAAEKLLGEGHEVDHETLRRWLLKEGLWAGVRRSRRHRSRRERKECFGQMVQMDGSHHDWFEGRRGKAVLMVMIDDATGCVVARFFEGETTEACYGVFEAWVDKYGMPASLYVDRDSIYRCERAPTLEEELAGKEPATQFGRVMAELGVKVILAHSPQAKGRVERCNGTLQDRLVKELRLAGIGDLEKANELLEKEFLPGLNKKFMVAARSGADAHRPNMWDLGEALNWEHERVVGKDWTVSWEGRCFQIEARGKWLGLAGKKVVVRRLRDGRVRLIWNGKVVESRELAQKPPRQKPEPRKVGRTKLHKPGENHPWRKAEIAVGKEYWRKAKARGAREKRARAHPAAASAAPTLRSGSATAAAG